MLMHKLYSPITQNGKNYIAKITVEEYMDNCDTRKRFYNLHDIEISPSSVDFISNENPNQYAKLGDDITVSDLFNLVKTYDIEFNTIKTMYQTALESTESMQGETIESGLQDGVYNKKQSVAKNSGRIYNKNTDQYRIMWTIEEGVMNDSEVSQFYDLVGEVKRGMKFPKTFDGETIFEIENKIVYADTDY